MTTSMQLHWQERPLVACFHAAQSCQRGRPFHDPELQAALSEPVDKLVGYLQGFQVKPIQLFDHAIPLAANLSIFELSRLLMSKVVLGPTDHTLTAMRNLLGAIQQAYQERTAAETSSPLAQAEPLKQQWQQLQAGLLTAVARWTEPLLIAPEATVVVVPDHTGGGGASHARYKLAHLEVVAGDPLPSLPEVLRLLWMVAGLNQGLPVFSEAIRPQRLPIIAPLALVPVTLAAGEFMQLCTSDNAMICQAADAWVGQGPPDRNERLLQWWEAYRAMRPSWSKALNGLDLLLS